MLRVPRHPFLLARFGLAALPPADLSARIFRTSQARALWAGLAAHVNLPMHTPGAGAAGLMLGTAAHAGGWPFPRGGAQSLADALAEYFRFLGGEIRTGVRVKSRADLPPARAVLVDSSPAVARQLLQRSTPAYDAWLDHFRYGLGVLKVDYALSGPVPWLDPAATQAATLHIGGSLEEIRAAELGAARGELSAQPFILAAQHTLFDSSRAPAGGHTLWAYTHAPADVSPAYAQTIDAALERLAPGFRQLVVHRRVSTSRDIQAFSPVFGGGDVNGGRFDLPGLLARPVPTPTPYRTPDPQVYLCSSSTPPGGGVHGMCGYHAAQAALHDLFGLG
ncbi:phytoene desaturase family protein [Deinococcus radiophilus]|uniref:phytoene desaturase family protein n=1 Tax=Deinococcus radiophilus TaxID=32062 RepID=UPI0036060C7E